MSKPPVNYDELFPGRFLKSGLLGDRKVTLRIASVSTEALPQDKGPDRVRGIISFEKTELQLVLNSTNGQCLRGMFGTHIPDWIGKRVVFFREKDRFGRDVVDAIRIWGSPDIPRDLRLEIRMPRKKAVLRTLHATGAQPEQPSEQEPAPEPDREPREDG